MGTITQTSEKVRYEVDYQGEYIELKVYGPSGNLRRKYTVDNEDKQFQQWCIENGHAREEFEREADMEEDGFSVEIYYNTDGLEESADLVLQFCLDTIKEDFPQ